MSLDVNGAEHFAGVLDEAKLSAVERALSSVSQCRAGVRLYGLNGLQPILAPDGTVGAVAARFLGDGCRPVRAVLFDKSEAANWGLGWHQDRTIAVAEKVEALGFGPWSRKGGVVHVEPPFRLLERMLTLRVHLDPAGEDNAPLLVAPGSHRFGRVPEADVPSVVERCGTLTCLAERGDVWVYATAILHASEAARRPIRRRVLQIDYSADDLPFGLKWAGV